MDSGWRAEDGVCVREFAGVSISVHTQQWEVCGSVYNVCMGPIGRGTASQLNTRTEPASECRVAAQTRTPVGVGGFAKKDGCTTIQLHSNYTSYRTELRVCAMYLQLLYLFSFFGWPKNRLYPQG